MTAMHAWILSHFSIWDLMMKKTTNLKARSYLNQNLQCWLEVSGEGIMIWDQWTVVVRTGLGEYGPT
jgi:hypothetical protein